MVNILPIRVHFGFFSNILTEMQRNSIFRKKKLVFYLHFLLLDLSASATLYPTMQDMNCKEE